MRAQQAIIRGLLAIVCSEGFFLAISLLIASNPAEVFTSYSRYTQREWIIRVLVQFGVFGIGVASSVLQMPLWSVILGTALTPWAMLWMSLDQLSAPTEMQLWYIPGVSTVFTGLPVVVLLIARAVRKSAGFLKQK